jgi:hypothetical protein
MSQRGDDPFGAAACGDAAVEAAVRRHPSAVPGRTDPLELARQVLALLQQQRVPWPAVAAAALGARGAQRLGRAAFAMSLGIEPNHLASVEAGRCRPAEVPLPLRRSAAYAALLAGLAPLVVLPTPAAAPDTTPAPGRTRAKVVPRDRPP